MQYISYISLQHFSPNHCQTCLMSVLKQTCPFLEPMSVFVSVLKKMSVFIKIVQFYIKKWYICWKYIFIARINVFFLHISGSKNKQKQILWLKCPWNEKFKFRNIYLLSRISSAQRIIQYFQDILLYIALYKKNVRFCKKSLWQLCYTQKFWSGYHPLHQYIY